MAGSVNKVIILGNLGKDPEVRSFANGGKVCNLTVATSETWKDKTTGEKKDRTEWHRVAIMNEPLVNIAEKYLRKGSKVYLEGQLETRKWTDASGAEKYSTEVVLRPFRGELTLLDAREGGGGQAPAGGGTGSGDYRAQSGGGFGGGHAPAPDLDDEIPLIARLFDWLFKRGCQHKWEALANGEIRQWPHEHSVGTWYDLQCKDCGITQRQNHRI